MYKYLPVINVAQNSLIGGMGTASGWQGESAGKDTDASFIFPPADNRMKK